MARRVKQSRNQIAKKIEHKVADLDEVDRANKALARAARDYWRRVSPVSEDPKYTHYRDATHVRKLPPDRKGLPRRRVYNDDWKNVFIEFGTEGDSPTPEFAPRGQTLIRFKR